MDQQTGASSSGLQGNSQNPQNAVQPANQAPSLSSIQAVTPGSLLSQSNVHLTNQSTTTTTSTRSNHVSQKPVAHKLSPGLLALPVILILASIVFYWLARRSVNKTTND